MRYRAGMGNIPVRLTDINKARFLQAFTKTGIIIHGCRAAGIARSTYDYWLKGDEDFRDAAHEAYETAVDEAEAELRRRGVEGYEEAVLYKGEPVWRRNHDGSFLLNDDFERVPFTVKRHSDRLLEVYTRAHRPQYSERHQIELTGRDGGPLESSITVNYVLPPGKTEADYEQPLEQIEHQTGAIDDHRDQGPQVG